MAPVWVDRPDIFRWRPVHREQLDQRATAQVLRDVEIRQLTEPEAAEGRIDDGVTAVAAKSAVRPMLMQASVMGEGPDIVDSADAVVLRQVAK